MEVANPIYDVVFKYLMEDEYFSIIEKQDTEILMKSRELAERTIELEESKVALEESKVALEESNAKLKKWIRMFQNSGMSIEDMAKNLGEDVETIRKLMSI